MQDRDEIRKKANRLFYTKVIISTLLFLICEIFIVLFLQELQFQTTLEKQKENSKSALSEVISTLEENTRNTKAMSNLYHDGNQDMLDDLQYLLSNGFLGSLTSQGSEDRCEIFRTLAERSDVDYLFLLDADGRVLFSPAPNYYRKTLTEIGLMSSANADMLLRGTRSSTGSVSPALETKRKGRAFFYSVSGQYEEKEYVLVLGVKAGAEESGISTLQSIEPVLRRASLANNGFIFAVDVSDSTFLYYRNGSEVLTGKNIEDAGLSQDVLQSGHDGIETINGNKYYCVSRVINNGTVLCAASDTDTVFFSDRLALSWTIMSFFLVMTLCIIYTLIVRNDFIRNEVHTKKRIFFRWTGHPLFFDITIFRKVFPLMVVASLLILGTSFYSQTLLEISQTAKKSVAALDDVFERYQSSVEKQEAVQEGHDNRYIAKARLIAYMLEENPSVLNEPSDRAYSTLNKNDDRVYLTDDEGNRLRSVSSSTSLRKLCKMNNLDSIYVFDENGHTIATNTEFWYYTISRDPEDESYPFLQLLDGKKDIYIENLQIGDMQDPAQCIGVEFHYYTALDEQGHTVYLSRQDYENQNSAENPRPITAHRSFLQICPADELRSLTSTKIEYSFSSNILKNGSFLLFDSSDDHICLYSPLDENIGMKAADMGISKNAFEPGAYYGFSRVNGTSSFLYSCFRNGNYFATLIPRSAMFPSRGRIALSTVLISLFLILFLSGTITLTSADDDLIYSTINDAENNRTLESRLFNMFFPFYEKPSPVKDFSRWDNRRIPWKWKNPEQKLTEMLNIACVILVSYLIITVALADSLFPADSVIIYILRGGWDHGFNIFAFSYCILILISIRIVVALLRIPLLFVTSLLGSRSETIGHLLLSVVKYGAVIGTVFYCLYIFGMDSTSLLASAGVISIVIGFGAQSLIQDILAGIFFVFEGEFRIGDMVTIGDFRGRVIDIGLRTTKILEPEEANIKIFNHSTISGVLNMTKKTSRAFCRISIEYGQDIDYVEAVLKRDLPKMRANNPKILSDPVFLGVSALGDSGVELLIEAQCSEEEIKRVTRYVNKELLKIFYRNGIGVPFPNVTVSTLDTEHRKTMADFKDFDPDFSSWWDSESHQTRVITISSLGNGMERALYITEQLAKYRGLERKPALQLRLLAEELFGLLRGIAGDVAASYWIVVDNTLYEIHMEMQLYMTRELRKQFLDVSTNRENAAASGFLGRLQDMIFTRLFLKEGNPDQPLPQGALSDQETFPGTNDTEEWTVNQYSSDIDIKLGENADAENRWDELEKSIIAQLADEIKVSMQGTDVEIIVFKDFSKD